MPRTTKAHAPHQAKAKGDNRVFERVTLDAHDWARLAEKAAVASHQAGRIIGRDEYLMDLVMDAIRSR
jgi:hypothetical protein